MPKSKRYLTAIVSGVAIVGGLLAYNFETIKVYLFYKQECLASAIDAGDGRKLGTCGRHVYDNGLGMPEVTVVIYDSSDQLVLPEAQRSHEWEAAAEKLGLRQEGVKESSLTNARPVKLNMLDIFGNITPLGGHFYRVTE